MLPRHGKIECRRCFHIDEGAARKPAANWRMINDPGAWGGGSGPDYLVLGFSKGATQAGIYDSGRFEDIAFAGMRSRLTEALRAMGVLGEHETSEAKINDPNSNVAFGSLIRCSVSRLDRKASAKAGQNIFACTGPLIIKSFAEIPEVMSNCAGAFLTDLPASVRSVFFLGNTDAYVVGCQSLLLRLFPNGFRQINPVAVRANGRYWIHIAHPSGLNGHFKAWLNAEDGPGLKRKQARAAAIEAQQAPPGDSSPVAGRA
jgi:hypothetical protein